MRTNSMFHYFVFFFFCKQRLTLFQKLNVLKVRLVYKTSIVTGQCFFSLGNFTRLIRIIKFVIGPKEYVCNFFFLQYK